MNVLREKADEYSDPEGNRLQQFYDAAEDLAITPVGALINMAGKHWTSILNMARTNSPEIHPLKQWNEKITDLRNNTLLLDALLRDMEVE